MLAWAVIDEHGAVEATHIVEGDPEFAEAVESMLAKTRFIPAHDLGKKSALLHHARVRIPDRCAGARSRTSARRVQPR